MQLAIALAIFLSGYFSETSGKTSGRDTMPISRLSWTPFNGMGVMEWGMGVRSEWGQNGGQA
jgi:hypothetical protein